MGAAILTGLDQVGALEAVALAALEMVREGDQLGLGTGRAAKAFVTALGLRVREGLRVAAMPTSGATAVLAKSLGIPLLDPREAPELRLVFDGADEVSPSLDLIKGYGGALVREKIVASLGERFVVLIGEEKLVSHLGERGRIPVEVIPFASGFVARKVAGLGLLPSLRQDGESNYETDNSNWILDCGTSGIADPAALDQALLQIPGVVGTGIFANMADIVLVGTSGGVRRLERLRPREAE